MLTAPAVGEAEGKDSKAVLFCKLSQLHVGEAEERRAEQWAEGLLAEGRTMLDLPALSDASTLLIRDTAAQNIFIAQPQQRNLSGRIFGGFLMRLRGPRGAPLHLLAHVQPGPSSGAWPRPRTFFWDG